MFMMFPSLVFYKVEAQNSSEQNMPELPPTVHPSKVVVISVLAIMFAITFLLLFYVKFCRISPIQISNPSPSFQTLNGLTRSWSSRLSGIDKLVIETLPFFKFSSLKGSKEGLECTVCLSKFEETEILRLLPKCKHAFHMNCIDKWLESHSTCPLCRYKVEEVDIKNFNHSLSSRFLRVPSNLNDDPNVEIFVQRELSHRGSSRFNIGSGFWDMGKNKKEEFFIDQEGGSTSSDVSTKSKPVHNFNHRILISDFVTRTRWSDLNSSDLLSLSCEMLIDDISSNRFSPLKPTNTEKFQASSNEEEKSFTTLDPSEKRSMSEIANVPRFAGISKQNRIREYEASCGEREERLWKIWLPIARRTVQLFATQERNSVELEHKPLASII
ncbi:putative chromatin regulator PHD family [Lupinus albus]|uniref:RING-type E3 ubiquitin transferase n=1 Tax=Lupinus albus TaxID=3870 RepID=A0A6A4PQI1_LUPAL|nr:putative chromatin regulator PHD family [Lupinus albus]